MTEVNRLIDRLVDGDLSDDERRQLLLDCEINPDRWRDLALAYVEFDVLRTEFAGLSYGRTADSPTGERAPAKRSMGMMLKIAAMLLLCLATGYGLGSVEWPRAASSRQLAVPKASPQKKEMENDQEQIYVLVDEPQDTASQPLRVPLVRLEELDSFDFVDRHDARRGLWSELRNRGHSVSHDRRWYPVQLQDGRRAFVPIDNVRVRFDGFQ